MGVYSRYFREGVIMLLWHSTLKAIRGVEGFFLFEEDDSNQLPGIILGGGF